LQQEINVCQFLGTEQFDVMEKRERERGRGIGIEQFHIMMLSVFLKETVWTII
jgi:hypothetical protein